MKNYTPTNYADMLENTDWSPVLQSECPDSAWSTFKDIFIGILDRIVPEKTVRTKQRTEPWMSSQILEKIAMRDGLFTMYKQSSDTSIKCMYNKLRTEVQSEIKEANSDYGHVLRAIWASQKSYGNILKR